MKSGWHRLRNQSGRSPVPLARSSGGPSIFNLLGGQNMEAYMRAYGSVGTIHGMFSLLAHSTGRTEWRMYRKSKDNRVRYSTTETGSDQRVEVVQHAALNLWKKPNPFYSGRTFRELSQLYLDLTGEMPWIVGRDPRVTFPTSLWTVRPDRLEPVPHPELFISGYVYTGPNGEQVPLTTDDVIMTKLPNPLDPLHGLGPVQAMLVDADASRYSAQWNRNFFLNSAEPGGVVSSPQKLNDTEFEEFQTRWRETHKGINAAHSVALLENMTWIPNAISQRDMDFANLRNQSRDVMRETVGIHKVMLGVSDDVNRANAQTGEEVFESWKVVPRLDRMKDTLDDFYLPMFYPPGGDVPVELDYVTPVPANREQDNQELTAKANAALLLVQAGYDPQAILTVVGLPQMDMADVAAIAADQPGGPEGSPASQTPIPGETEAQTNARIMQAIYNSVVR